MAECHVGREACAPSGSQKRNADTRSPRPACNLLPANGSPAISCPPIRSRACGAHPPHLPWPHSTTCQPPCLPSRADHNTATRTSLNSSPSPEPSSPKPPNPGQPPNPQTPPHPTPPTKASPRQAPYNTNPETLKNPNPTTPKPWPPPATTRQGVLESGSPERTRAFFEAYGPVEAAAMCYLIASSVPPGGGSAAGPYSYSAGDPFSSSPYGAGSGGEGGGAWRLPVSAAAARGAAAALDNPLLVGEPRMPEDTAPQDAGEAGQAEGVSVCAGMGRVGVGGWPHMTHHKSARLGHGCAGPADAGRQTGTQRRQEQLRGQGGLTISSKALCCRQRLRCRRACPGVRRRRTWVGEALPPHPTPLETWQAFQLTCAAAAAWSPSRPPTQASASTAAPRARPAAACTWAAPSTPTRGPCGARGIEGCAPMWPACWRPCTTSGWRWRREAAARRPAAAAVVRLLAAASRLRRSRCGALRRVGVLFGAFGAASTHIRKTPFIPAHNRPP